MADLNLRRQLELLRNQFAVEVSDSITSVGGVISFVNDSDAPGNTKYYGTNGLGVKGWYTLTAGASGGGVVDNSERLDNQLPSYYLTRANHIGTQAFNTIIGLSVVASSNLYSDLTGIPSTFAPSAHTQPASTIIGLGSLATQSGTFSGTSSGTNTGDQNLFSTFIVAGQSNVVADSTSDSVTFIAGAGMTITTDASSDSITFTATATGAGGTNYYNTTYLDQTGGTGDTYGVLAGAVNGVNALFTVSQTLYASGSLKVYLNGQLQTQGSSEDWVETNPALGTFTFNTAPSSGDMISAEYQLTSTGGGGGGPITLTGAVTGTGTSAIVTALAASSVNLINLSATGAPSASKYLRGDWTWATIVAGGSGSTNDIELSLQMVTLISYVEYTYDVGGNLTNKDIWEDNTKTNKYYSILYSYTGDDLTSIEVTRESDSFIYTKTFAYSGGNLISSTIT